MGLLDRLMGRDEPERPQQAPPGGAARSEDEQALERYRYLVRTAPPERIEQAHEEAFAKLTPEQRRMALEQLSQSVPEHEAAGSDDPRSLARMATRAEMREPGTVERAFGGGRGGMGMGMGGMAVPLLGSFATAFVGTLAAQALFADMADGGLIDSFGNEGDGGGDLASDGGGDPGGDPSGGDFSAGDLGGGDFGGDLGGGDFGF
jgi:hypothetical protein